MIGYVYILTHPGIPTLFYDHVFEWNLDAMLKELVEIRKKAGIHAKSPIKILTAESHCYIAEISGINTTLKVPQKSFMISLELTVYFFRVKSWYICFTYT